MENGYLIPANSKRSMLIFGLFKVFDLILFSIGISLTFILLLTVPMQDLTWSVISIAPGLICGFLVLPLPNYYNVRAFLTDAWIFYTTRQKFIWKGWCVLDGKRE